MSPRQAVTAAGVAALLVLPTACTSQESRPPEAPSTSAAPTADPTPDEASAAAATATAQQFLTAIVAADHATAFGLLSEQARTGQSPESYAVARERKIAASRGLGTWELTGATGGPDVVTVIGTGRLTDGTRVELAVPVRRVADGWRVDAVPTAF